jgi:hypothetical protein
MDPQKHHRPCLDWGTTNITNVVYVSESDRQIRLDTGGFDLIPLLLVTTQGVEVARPLLTTATHVHSKSVVDSLPSHTHVYTYTLCISGWL